MDGARPLKRNDAAVGRDRDGPRAVGQARRRADLGYVKGVGAVYEYAYEVAGAAAVDAQARIASCSLGVPDARSLCRGPRCAPAVGGGDGRGYRAERAANGHRPRAARGVDRPVVGSVGIVHLDAAAAAVAAVAVRHEYAAVRGGGDAGRVDERGRGEKAGAVDLARQGAVGAEYAHGKIVGAEVVAHQGQDRAVGGGGDSPRGQPVRVAFQCSREPAGVLVVAVGRRGGDCGYPGNPDIAAARERAGRSRRGQGQVCIAAVVRVRDGRVGIGQDERGGARVRQVGRHVALFYSVLEYEGARARPALVQRAAVPLARLQLDVRRILKAGRVRDVDGL